MAERNGWQREHQWEADAVEAWKQAGHAGPYPQAFTKGPLAALVSRDAILGAEHPRWHVSVQHQNRVPNWDELVATAHELRPGVCFVIGVPPRSFWINVHPHVLHLYEVDDEPLTRQWMAERQGHTPT
jgi:hypothetical protein